MPLAIKTIGRVLYFKFKTTKVEWLDIKNNELTNVTQPKNGLLPVLKLSYNHLPSYLKCCFAYCSLFPKNYLIDKLTLIQLWIAQGFIQSPEKKKQLEDIANKYFMDLHWRLVNSNSNNVIEKVHHLSFSFANVSFFRENLSTLVKANKIRTFILTYDPWIDVGETMEESTLKTLISSFRYLRALDLHSLKINILSNIIGTLMHLKYLDLSLNDIGFHVKQMQP